MEWMLLCWMGIFLLLFSCANCKAEGEPRVKEIHNKLKQGETPGRLSASLCYIRTAKTSTAFLEGFPPARVNPVGFLAKRYMARFYLPLRRLSMSYLSQVG